MTALEIAALILQNAPAILATAEEVFEWGIKTYREVMASLQQPADTITKEQLLSQLDRIKANDAEIQAIP